MTMVLLFKRNQIFNLAQHKPFCSISGIQMARRNRSLVHSAFLSTHRKQSGSSFHLIRILFASVEQETSRKLFPLWIKFRVFFRAEQSSKVHGDAATGEPTHNLYSRQKLLLLRRGYKLQCSQRWKWAGSHVVGHMSHECKTHVSGV